MYRGQAEQDKFVLNITKEKRGGFFVEIGSGHPEEINNSYILETVYGWNGIMIDNNAPFLPLYVQKRPNSIHVINDATKIDYAALFAANNVPTQIDYLQVDLEVENSSTIVTLEKLNTEVFDRYTCAVITFEHDIWRGDYYNTRMRSRELLANRGYVRVFSDIHNGSTDWTYEDWYVHPSLVDMTYVNTLIPNNQSMYVFDPRTGKSINWRSIKY
jgi:hypothetical protein